MGLDGVEIIMEIEDTFNIQIQDEEAQFCLTPKSLIDLVISKVNMEAGDETCLTQKAFHLCRKSYFELSNIPRIKFRPQTLLNEIIPKTNRSEFLVAWQKKMKLPTFPKMFSLFSSVRRVEDLVGYVVRTHPETIKAKEKVWRPGEIRTIVRQIISDKLDIKKFKDEANFVKDLGLQ